MKNAKLNKRKHAKETIEKIIDMSIPILVIILGIIILLELTVDVKKYEQYFKYVDFIIVLFFSADLYFKWLRTKKVKVFIRLYWIDILAVFPFYLIFRVYLFFTEFVKTAEQAQKALHEFILIRETKLVEESFKEAEILAKTGRAERLLKLAQRFVRISVGRFYFTRSLLLKHHGEVRKRS